MKRFWIAGLGLLPLVSACSLFETNPVPPRPALSGVSAQDAAWQNQVRRVRGEEEARFEPLTEAREAVTAARAQPDVESYDSTSLSEAEAALEEAEQAWAGIDNKRSAPAEALANVAESAHRARRLAEIARFTALREINLEQLMAANDELEARAQAEAQGQSRAASGSRDVVPVTGAAREMIGQKVIPDQIGDVSFETGTARMKAESQAVVERLAAMLKRTPSVGVAIFGHTDNVAPSPESIDRFVDANPGLEEQAPSRSEKIRAFNLALSAARARTVARALVENGIPARRIGARGFGDTRPVASNDTDEGRRANRRIEAVIVPGPDSPEARQARANNSQ
jgi:outer membrane protein OmpA-like peptidoglycan-associated protein